LPKEIKKRLEDLILWRYQYYPKQSTDSVHP
jgi:hypothetical protein